MRDDPVKRLSGGRTAVFIATTFLAATLLFMVQPMAGRLVLPLLGGSPAVWNTCMVFFQCALLAAYGTSHVVVTRLSVGMQAVAVTVFLAACAVLPPAAVDLAAPAADDVRDVWLIRTLFLGFGIPFFGVATLAPLLQAWLAGCGGLDRRGGPGEAGVYSLYAASNTGSLFGLLAYPFVIEPLLARSDQCAAWTMAFRVLAVLFAACAVLRLAAPPVPVEPGAPSGSGISPPPFPQLARWCLLTAIPSSLMLGVTQQITTDIAAFPLLWVIPLALYLITFIVAFSSGRRPSARFWSRAAVPTTLAALFLVLEQWNSPLLPVLFVHLANFFVLSMCCHTALAAERPPVRWLTTFYFCMSLGGLAGGLFNTFVAPLIFNDVFEYPLAVAAALLVCPFPGDHAGGGSPRVSPAGYRGWLGPIAIAAASTLAVVWSDRWIRSGGFGSSVQQWLATLHSFAAVWLPLGGLSLAALRRQHRTYALLTGALLAATAWMGPGRELFRERPVAGPLAPAHRPRT